MQNLIIPSTNQIQGALQVYDQDIHDLSVLNCKKRMNLATNNGNTWSDKTVLFGH